jgi:hypothetical protein
MAAILDGRVRITPAEERLAEQERLLAELTEQLASKEAELASVQLALDRFRVSYLARFAPAYAELDRLEAEVLRLVAQRTPPGASEARTAQARAEEAEARAEESKRAAEGAEEILGIPTEPSAEIKALYRRVAKAVHPDLAADDEDRERRTRLMAAASRAYADGDEATLRRILDGEVACADAIKGDDIDARLVRVHRQIAQVRARLTELVALRRVLEADPMWQLLETVRAASDRGEDALEQAELDLRRRIGSARAQLAALRTEVRT